MLSFQRKSLSFEIALSYLQAFTSNSHEFLWKRSSLFQHFNSLCEVNWVLLQFLNAVLSEINTFLLNCLNLITNIHKKLTCISWRKAVCSNTSIHCANWMDCCFTFSMLYFQRKSLSFEAALSYLQAFSSNSHAFLWKRRSLFQHFNSLCEVNGVLLHFLNAVLSEKNPLIWNCLKLLTRIQQQLTCVSLKEKQSVPTLQFTVRSEWSVASLSKCCPFRENHFPLKLP